MAFLDGSRYGGIETVTVEVAGRRVTAIKLRALPSPPSRPIMIEAHDRLDIIAQREYQDGTRFWHIADANSELEANDLVATGRIVEIPE